ncbi:hypothetical protein EDD85DRAFT_787023 [Armillaria nabsnona]|nr:hypothetical protein EDD85DRAFT_787023 [Armillaria nabsnona]
MSSKNVPVLPCLCHSLTDTMTAVYFQICVDWSGYSISFTGVLYFLLLLALLRAGQSEHSIGVGILKTTSTSSLLTVHLGLRYSEALKTSYRRLYPSTMLVRPIVFGLQTSCWNAGLLELSRIFRQIIQLSVVSSTAWKDYSKLSAGGKDIIIGIMATEKRDQGKTERKTHSLGSEMARTLPYFSHFITQDQGATGIAAQNTSPLHKTAKAFDIYTGEQALCLHYGRFLVLNELFNNQRNMGRVEDGINNRTQNIIFSQVLSEQGGPEIAAWYMLVVVIEFNICAAYGSARHYWQAMEIFKDKYWK